MVDEIGGYGTARRGPMITLCWRSAQSKRDGRGLAKG